MSDDQKFSQAPSNRIEALLRRTQPIDPPNCDELTSTDRDLEELLKRVSPITPSASTQLISRNPSLISAPKVSWQFERLIAASIAAIVIVGFIFEQFQFSNNIESISDSQMRPVTSVVNPDLFNSPQFVVQYDPTHPLSLLSFHSEHLHVD